MNTEQAALEFVVGLTSKGVDASVTKLVNAFAKVASAAQFAHNAIQGDGAGGGGGGGGGGGTTAPGGSGRAAKELTKTVNAQISVLTMLKAHMVSLGVTAVGKVWHVMTQGVGIAFDALVEHEKEMIKMRKSLAMTAEESNKFSGNLIRATALYGGNISTVRHLAGEMRSGLVRTDEAAATLAGRLANLETRSGMSGSNLATAAKLWTNYLGVFSDTELDKSLRVLKETSYPMKANANAILEMSLGAKGIYSNWQTQGPKALQEMVRNVQVLGLSYEGVGGDAKDLVGLLEKGGDRTSRFAALMNQYDGNFTMAAKEAATIIEQTTEVGGQRERVMAEFGLSAETFKLFQKAVAKMKDAEVAYNLNNLKTTKDLEDAEKNRMTGLEKMGETLTKLKLEAMGIGTAFADWFNRSEFVKGSLEGISWLMSQIKTNLSGGPKIDPKDPAKGIADRLHTQAALGQGDFLDYPRMVGDFGLWLGSLVGVSSGPRLLKNRIVRDAGKMMSNGLTATQENANAKLLHDKVEWTEREIAAGRLQRPAPPPSVPTTGMTLGLGAMVAGQSAQLNSLTNIEKGIQQVAENTKKGPVGSTTTTGPTQSSLRE